jgi:hypothetical protein
MTETPESEPAGDDVVWPEPADEPEQEPTEPWARDDEEDEP